MKTNDIKLVEEIYQRIQTDLKKWAQENNVSVDTQKMLVEFALLEQLAGGGYAVELACSTHFSTSRGSARIQLWYNEPEPKTKTEIKAQIAEFLAERTIAEKTTETECDGTGCDREVCQVCCSHSEHDHFMCLDCGREGDASDYYGDASDYYGDR